MSLELIERFISHSCVQISGDLKHYLMKVNITEDLFKSKRLSQNRVQQKNSSFMNIRTFKNVDNVSNRENINVNIGGINSEGVFNQKSKDYSNNRRSPKPNK